MNEDLGDRQNEAIPAPDSAMLERATDPEIRPIEDLTLSELINRWLRSPGATWRGFRLAAASHGANRPQSQAAATAIALQSSEAIERERGAMTALRALAEAARQVDAVQLFLYAAAIISALIGSVIVRGGAEVTRADGYSLSFGGPMLWLAFLLWLIAEIVGGWARLTGYWRALDAGDRLRWAARALPILLWFSALFAFNASLSAPRDSATVLALTAIGRFGMGCAFWLAIEVANWQIRRRRVSTDVKAPKIIIRRSPFGPRVSRSRLALITVAAICSLLVWMNTAGNRIEPPVILLWLLGAALWAFVFAPLRWSAFSWASGKIDRFRRIRWRDHRGTIAALAVVMLLGAAFRFNKLEAYPPQMYSDQVEKIQDAYKIHHFADYRIFFANIGGREPLHFYFLSLLASQPGMAFDHYALKFMSAIESLITLPTVFWLGVEVMGKDRRRLGLLVGALAAALVAVSFWHTVIGRQGLRISLAPLFSALTAVYLIRAIRCNRRSDYVKAGLALGFGLLGYQAVRMLPLAAVAGVALAFVFGKHSWRTRLDYLLNLAVLAFVALMVFLPMLHYWIEEPENYMRRANTRVFGDMPTTDAERAAFLADSVPVLLNNIRMTALMFHFYGDNSWVSGLGDEPAMDPVSAAFMLLGLAAWLALIVKTREPALAFVPIYLVAMLLPTALALSFPIEVPSFIRASGAIPPAYLIAALPFAVFCLRLCKCLSGRAGKVIAAVIAAVLLLAANHYNTSLYFGRFTDNFVRASHPQAQAGAILRGFAESDGAYGNAFVLASAHWWDTRAIGIEAGMMFWDSGGEARATPQLIERGLQREAPYRLDPERDLLFFYARQNLEALELLSGWFPTGRPLLVDVEPEQKSFYVFRAPALGAAGLRQFLDENR